MGTSSASAPLVDVHVHLYPDAATGQQAKNGYVIWEYGDDPGVEFFPANGIPAELTATYEQAGFSRAVVVHLFDASGVRADAQRRLAGRGQAGQGGGVEQAREAAAQALMASNRWVAGLARASPLLEVMIGIDPTVLTAAEIENHVTELVGQGIIGVKLHPVAQGFLPSDPRLDAVYRVCSEAGLVVLSHSGPGQRVGASARPREFAPVLQRWPSLRLILAHLGGASWREAAALAGNFPRACFDLSEVIEWVGAPSAPSAAELARLIGEIGADRVMLGSDFPWYDPARTADRVDSLPGLGTEERAALLGGTAMRVLDLEQSA